MADPKYADLPGIAYDQPDVYETNDLPESDQNADFYEEESDSIERLHISASEAFSKFKGKALSAVAVDFSDRLSRTRRTGYDARSGDWELVGDGEKETALQKFQRLQCEMKELMEEVTHLKEKAKDASPQEQTSCSLLASQVEQSQQQLAEVWLEEALGSELLNNLADPQGAQLAKLLSELESLKQTSGTGTDTATSTKTPKGEGKASTITYQLNYRPEQAVLARSARVVDLEQRLHRLEAALGATPEKLATLCVDPANKGKACGLLQAAQLLNAKASLLDTAHLDLVEGRLTALVLKMDAVAEKSVSTAQDADRDRKVVELYDLVKKNTEDVSQVLPQTLERMLALESLHQQAVDFSKSLSQLEALQQQISTGLESNETLVKSIQDSVAQNVATIKSNVNSLDARITALAKK